MQFKNVFLKMTAGILSAFLLGLFGKAGYYSLKLPDHITADSDDLSFGAFPSLNIVRTDDDSALSFMGAIPVKAVSVSREEPPTLIAGGSPFGIKLLMEGVMVTELCDVDGNTCPAKAAGVELGDVITHADGIPLTSNDDIRRIITEGDGKSVSLRIERDGDIRRVDVTPVFSEKDSSWHIGIWVRDSIAGIGTLTFIDKATGQFSGLGHPVCDSDTGELIPLHSGEAVPVKITDTRRGQPGLPGELHGRFTGSYVYGTLTSNDPTGIFGTLDKSAPKLPETFGEYKMGYRQDVTIGDAYIITTIEGDKPKKYAASIEQVDYNSHEASKNMVIRIKDDDLISASGGIVQGMSGSPIIQNDRLVGAVTHVFVSDPTKGYGIFAENMYKGNAA